MSNDAEADGEDKKVGLRGSSRLTICVMNGVGLVLLILRSSIGLTIVCMLRKGGADRSRDVGNASDWTIAENTSLYDDFSTAASITHMIPSTSGEFDWSSAFVGHVMSSFYYGQLVTTAVAGWLAGRYGGKHVISIGTAVSLIAILLTPAAIRYDKHLFVVIRVVVGMATGTHIPATLAIGGNWYVPTERSIMMSATTQGITLGIIVSYLITTGFCSLSVDNGWPLTFYFVGGASVVFLVVWQFTVYNSPDEHPRITQREREYIATSTAIQTSIAQRPSFPWLKAISSLPVFALVFTATTNTWFLFTAMMIPLYFRDVLQFNIGQNGLWLILPQILSLITTLPVGWLADLLIRRRIFSSGVVRKIFQSISSFGCSAILVVISFLDYDQRYIATGLLTLLSPIQTTCRSGYVSNYIEIAPRYSGEIYGISGMFCTLSGILAPIAVGYLTTNGSKREWQTVFYIAAAMFVCGGLVFNVFAKTTILPWASTCDDDKPKQPVNKLAKKTSANGKQRSVAIE